MSASNIASVPVAMTGFPVFKNAEAVFDTNHAKQLKEWLECQDFILAMVGVFMGYPKCNLRPLKYFRVMINEAKIAALHRNPEISTYLPKPITDVPANFSNIALFWATLMHSQLRNPLETLRVAKVSDKREVLRYMNIISTPVAAVFLGITEDMLNEIKLKSKKLIGAEFAGGHCYSMAVLELISQNLHWAYGYAAKPPSDFVRLQHDILDHMIMVDERTAMAFTDTDAVLLSELVKPTMHSRRPYRLSDLEKIRVAKLNSQQQ